VSHPSAGQQPPQSRLLGGRLPAVVSEESGGEDEDEEGDEDGEGGEESSSPRRSRLEEGAAPGLRNEGRGADAAGPLGPFGGEFDRGATTAASLHVRAGSGGGGGGLQSQAQLLASPGLAGRAWLHATATRGPRAPPVAAAASFARGVVAARGGSSRGGGALPETGFGGH
jgi:hypothetical protein